MEHWDESSVRRGGHYRHWCEELTSCDLTYSSEETRSTRILRVCMLVGGVLTG